MPHRDIGVVRSMRRYVLFAMLILTILGADECPNRNVNLALAEMLTSLPDTEWGAIDVSHLPHLRVHKYPHIIQKGDKVEPFTLESAAGATGSDVCQSQSGCLLFFVDTNHYAHFAHDTLIALWRLDTKTFQKPVTGQWWPLLKGEPIFDTVREREDWKDKIDPDLFWTVVYPTDFPRDYTPEFRDVDPLGIRVRTSSSYRMVAAGVGPDVDETVDCSKRAVIVNGYHDLEDTFHIDTGGMYQLLKGHGVPEDQIYYLCPKPEDTEGCDIKVHRDNLEEVLTRILGSDIPEGPLTDSPCQNLIVFYSAHGGEGSLYCGRCSDCLTIAHTTLEGWLDQVRCANVTVVVEACKSGGLIGVLGATPPAGQTRYVFTSTDDSQESYRDIDRIDTIEDRNPGDIGSETIWGYVESVASGSSDNNGDKEIKFNEAFEYAKDNDITTIIGNEPKKIEGGGPIGAVPSCADGPGTDALEIQLEQEETVGRAEPGQILRCRCNHLKATITGVAGGGPANPPPVAMVTFFWTDTPWTESSVPKWKPSESGNKFGDFREIRNSTRLLAIDGGYHTISLDWEVGARIEPGSFITVLALVDSPSSPIADSEINVDSMVGEKWASAIRLEIINPSSCFLFPCKGGSRRCEP